jgi:polyisoprenyl-phosphate glycosyltransferase
VSGSVAQLRVVVVIPVFNDWESFRQLLRDIDAIGHGGVRDLSVIAVDDGSTEPLPDDLAARLQLRHVRSLSLVRLKCNLGHQRAIAIGLALAVQAEADAVVVMDADGEDRPQDIRLLVEQHIAKPGYLIAARRAQRSEGPLFRVSYSLYKKVFRLLTGQDISFGNFSLIPMHLAKRLVCVPSLWNHFAATLLRSRLPLSLVPSVRGRRYAGQSKLNFVNLIVHGLSAISVFSDAMLTRLLLFFVLATSAGMLAAVVVVGLRLFTDLATPGWASSVLGSVAVISLQALLLTMMSAFLVLSTRSTIVLPPNEHAKGFVDEVVTLFPPAGLNDTTASRAAGPALQSAPLTQIAAEALLPGTTASV